MEDEIIMENDFQTTNHRKSMKLYNIFFAVLLVFIVIISMYIHDSSSAGMKNGQESGTDDKYRIVLSFGNGEKYSAQADCLYHSYNFAQHNFGYWDCSPLQIGDRELNCSGAVLSGGSIYSFSDACGMDYDSETRTVTISLWRDSPYEREKEYFEKIG